MNTAELIDLAAKKAGTQRDLAREMKKSPSRLSEWKSGDRVPDADEVAYLAKRAGLPVLVTIALIYKEKNPEHAAIWEEALGEAKAPSYWDKAAGLCILC